MAILNSHHAISAFGGNVTSVVTTVTINIGDCVVVKIMGTSNTTGTAASGVVDSSGTNTYIFKGRNPISAGSKWVETWVCASAGANATTVTPTVTNASDMYCLVSTYTGVASVGQWVGTGSGSDATPTASITIANANNWVVGGFTDRDTVVFTQNAGTLRDTGFTSGGVDRVAAGLADNTAVSIQSVTVSVTETDGGGFSWLSDAVELVVSGGGSDTLFAMSIF